MLHQITGVIFVELSCVLAIVGNWQVTKNRQDLHIEGRILHIIQEEITVPKLVCHYLLYTNFFGTHMQIYFVTFDKARSVPPLLGDRMCKKSKLVKLNKAMQNTETVAKDNDPASVLDQFFQLQQNSTCISKLDC